MISPWQIYIVMQLDSLNIVLVITSAIAVAAICLTTLFGVFERGSSQNYPESPISKREAENARSFFATAKKLALPTFALLAAAALLPSSKTAAAMYVIPAIANNEAIQAEAGDIYKLAKQGLTRLVSEEKKPAADEKKPD